MIYNDNRFYLRALKKTTMCEDNDKEQLKYLIQAILLGVKYFSLLDLAKVTITMSKTKHIHKAMAQLLALISYLTPKLILNIFPPAKIYNHKNKDIIITYQSTMKMINKININKPLGRIDNVITFLVGYNNSDIYNMMNKLAVLDTLLSQYKLNVDTYIVLTKKRKLRKFWITK